MLDMEVGKFVLIHELDDAADVFDVHGSNGAWVGSIDCRRVVGCG